MAKFLFATTPAPGHITPNALIVRRLLERGHEVHWYTGASLRAGVERAGAVFHPITHRLDFSVATLPELVPELPTATRIERIRLYIERCFIGAVPGQLTDLERILGKFPADVLVADPIVFAPPLVHERGGPPFARIANTRLGIYSKDTPPAGLGLIPGRFTGLRDRALTAVHRHVLFRRASRQFDDVRATFGLPPTGRTLFDTSMSPWLFMQDTVPSFEYPRRDLPPQVHFIGALVPGVPADYVRPQWWDKLSAGRPVVMVTESTVPNARMNLVDPAIAALGESDVTLLVTTERERPESLPGNVIVERFVPHAAVMPHVDVFVTNGGYGGVQMALSHGVPMVTAGVTEEKPDVTARVVWSGTGVRLPTDTPTADQLGTAVRKVLGDKRYAQAAARIAADLGTHDAPSEAADLLERLARTGQPVYR